MSHPSSGKGDAAAASSEGFKESQGTTTTTTSSSVLVKQGAAMEPSRTEMRFRIILAVTGLSLGVLVFCVFLAVEDFRNFHIACWGLVSGIFALFTLLVHVQHEKGDRDVWVNRLKKPIVIGFIVQFGSIAAFITYIVLAITENQSVMPLNGAYHGYYVTAVWIFMTWKWSFALFWYSRSYRRFYITKYVSIP